jgi:pyrroline-5-carboxylate reductase
MSTPQHEIGTIGIIGVGHLASYLVAGLMRSDDPPQIVLSPRNARRSRDLAARYGLSIARHNAAVVERADVVLLAARPPDLLNSCEDLPWSARQTVVSVAGGIARSAIESAVEPATVVRALPIAAAEIGESTTCLYPDNAVARKLFEPLGSVHSYEDEPTFDLASMQGVVFSVSHAVIRSITEWFERSGLTAEEGRTLTAKAIRAAAGMVLTHPEKSLDSIVAEYATPGSLTLLALERLRERNVFDGLQAALDSALARCREINAGTGPRG